MIPQIKNIIFDQLNLNSKVVDWQGSDQFPQKKNETDQFEDLGLRYDHPVLQISRYTDWLKYYF